MRALALTLCVAAITCGAPASPPSAGPLTGVVVASADAEVAIELRGIL